MIIGHVTASDQGLFVVPASDTVIGERLRSSGHWSWPQVQQWIEELRPSDRVLIVGAHIGTTAIPLAQHCAVVWAYEPNPEVFPYLKANIALNGLESRINAVQMAVSDREEVLRFRATRANSGGSKRLPKIDQSMYNETGQHEYEVMAQRLDVLHPTEVFDAIFMDIEGSEVFALAGMEPHLKTARMLVIEYIPHHLTNVAGVTPEEFANLLLPYFDTMEIPSVGKTVPKAEFVSTLREMFNRDCAEDGLIFRKVEKPISTVADRYGFLNPLLL